jgi:hypothetical protein
MPLELVDSEGGFGRPANHSLGEFAHVMDPVSRGAVTWAAMRPLPSLRPQRPRRVAQPQSAFEIWPVGCSGGSLGRV